MTFMNLLISNFIYIYQGLFRNKIKNIESQIDENKEHWASAEIYYFF